jgi:hypothetical protein
MHVLSVLAYNDALDPADRAICVALRAEIDHALPDADSKIWHGHPVWFLAGNPVAGYSKLKSSIRLLFWSGQSFENPGLAAEGSFKAAEARYTSVSQIDYAAVRLWLAECRIVQWDYKNIVKRRGKLERI